MRELEINEIVTVSGGLVTSPQEAFEGFMWGMIDGALTGMAIGGKFGGAGWWIAGSLAQLVGYSVTPFISGFLGAVAGALFGREAIAELAADFRNTVGVGNLSH